MVTVHSFTIVSSAIFFTMRWTLQFPIGNSTVLGLHLFSCPVTQNQKSIVHE